VWFCSAVGSSDFLAVEVSQIEKKSVFSQHMYLCKCLAPCSVLEKFSVQIYLRWWAFTPNVKSVLSENLGGILGGT
jgi:hypothetical protein